MSQHKSIPIFFASLGGLFLVLTVLWSFGSNIWFSAILALFVTLFVGIPGWFVLSLVLYLRAKKRGDDDLPVLKSRFTIAKTILVFWVIMLAALYGLFIMAISHM